MIKYYRFRNPSEVKNSHLKASALEFSVNEFFTSAYTESTSKLLNCNRSQQVKWDLELYSKYGFFF